MIMVGTLKIVIKITVLSPLPSSPLSVRSFEKSNSLNLILIIGKTMLINAEESSHKNDDVDNMVVEY